MVVIWEYAWKRGFNVPASLNSGAAQAPPRVDRGASAAATKRLYELNRGEQALLVKRDTTMNVYGGLRATISIHIASLC
jgi:hypothetical protein